MRLISRTLTAATAGGLLVAGLAGCSQNEGSTTGSSTRSAASASTTPSASATPALQTKVGGESTQITLDSGFTGALKKLGLTAGVVGDGKLSDAGVLTFPITGGHVTYYDPSTGVRPSVQGEIDHEDSGLTLSAGGKKVELRNLVIDPGNNSHVSGDVFLNGESVARDVNLFRLDGSTLNPVTKDGDAYVLEGTTVYVSDDAAKLLDDTYGTDAVTGELKVGVAKLTVTAATM